MSASEPRPARLMDDLCRLWADELRRPRIGVQDEFFAAGGTSLIAIRLTAAMSRLAGRKLAVRDLFQHPTIERMAELIASGGDSMADGAADALVPPDLTHVSRNGDLPANIRQRSLLVDSPWTGHSDPAAHLTVVLEARGRLSSDHVAEAMQLVVERHEVLRTRFLSPERLRLVRMVNCPVVVCDLRRLAPSSRRPRALAALRDLANHPFKLGSPPQLRAGVFRLQDEYTLVSVTVDHVVADGWSVNVILTDWARALLGIRAGVPPDLPGLLFGPADLDSWERARLGIEARELADCWRRHLDGRPAVPPFALEPERGPARPWRWKAVASAGPWSDVQRAAARAGVTPNALLMAATLLTMERWQPRGRHGVLSPFANRPHPASAGVVGWFSNLAPVYADVAPRQSLAELAVEVNETLASLQSIAHAPIQFIQAVADSSREWVGIPEEPSVWFAGVAGTAPELRVPGLGLTRLPVVVKNTRLHGVDVSVAMIARSSEAVVVAGWPAKTYRCAAAQRFARDIAGLILGA